MKKLFTLFLLAFLPLAVGAQVERTIHVAKAGTLSSYISEEEKCQIEELTLTGEINGTDFGFLREMAGKSMVCKNDQMRFEKTNGKLTILDLSGVNIVTGGVYMEVDGVDIQFVGYVESDGEIPHHIFYGCTNLTSITLPNSVTSIDAYAFAGCSGLTSITIPSSVTSIEDYAFVSCTGLTSITIPNSVTSIGSSAFSGCSLTSIKVESGNVTYDSRDNCNAIIETSSNTLITGCKNSIIPSSITSIGICAFSGCTGLTSITIPNSVTSIGSSAFSGCSGLTSITIPNSVTSIGIFAFGGTTWYDSQPDGIIYAGKVLYKYKGIVQEGTKIYIEEGTLGIAGAAFNWCTGLTSVTLPNSVISIGEGAFSGCSGLTSITIPNSVINIEGGAFLGCSGLTSITIPNSVTSIGDRAFESCSGLTSITIPNSVTSIGDRAFYNCRGLTSIMSEIQNPFGIKNSVFYCHDKDIYASALLTVLAGTKEKYQSTDGWKEFVNIVEMEEEEETAEDVIKITSAKQTTWCSAYDLDFSNVEGLKAYTATGYHRTKGTIWLTRVKEVPAGEGILLIGDEGEYRVPHKSTTAYYMNMFKGTVKAITINETDGEYTNYYLSNGASGVGFYKVNGSVDIKANRAYLPLLKNTVSGTRGFIGMDFDDDDDGTTGIDIQSSIFNVQSKGVYYNLQGLRVDNPTKGLYIRNGKKVVIK